LAYRGSLPDRIEDIAREIVDSSFRVHSALGPGLLESVYETCMHHDLRRRGLSVEKQVPVAITFDTLRIDAGLRIDLLVEKSIVVEIKSVERMIPVYQAQILSYLKLANLKLGFIVNFNVPKIREGIRRYAL
jgi:GxxExxY protein